MKFMLLVKASPQSEAGQMPTDELIATMTRFNQELMDAGVLRDANGLHPTSRAVRLKYVDGKPQMQEGPFASDDLVSGYWILEVASREEALQWALKAPAPGFHGDGETELRQIFGPEDFAPSPAVEEAFALNPQG